MLRTTSALLLAIALSTPSLAMADPVPGQPAPAPLVDWIAGLQWASGPAAGAVALDAGPALYHQDQAYRRVVPYFSNLAVAAVLEAAPSAEALALAEGWVEWSLAHLGARGVPAEWWVSADGQTVTDCPAALETWPSVDRCEHVDATDSAAATLLVVAEAYLVAGGDPQRVAAWAPGLRAVGATLAGLQDADGLTWARADYPVKFLMDNAETVAGFRALAFLEQALGDTPAANAALARAASAEAGLASMRDPATGLWAWARHGNGADDPADLDRWYADALAQVWPILFDAAPAADGAFGFDVVDAAYDGAARPDWATTPDPSGFERSSVAVAAVRAGAAARADAHIASVWDRRVAPPGGAPFAAPFTVADAGWLLRALVESDDAAAPPPAAVAAPPLFAVSAPFPNPTAGRAALDVTAGDDAEVTVEVFDVRGRAVATPRRLRMGAGATERVRLDADRLTPGVYVVRVVAGADVATHRLVVAR